jgi:hypothetical protein
MAIRFGQPHRDYSSPKGRVIVDTIFAAFTGFLHGDPTEIYRKSGVPARTVRDWHNH